MSTAVSHSSIALTDLRSKVGAIANRASIAGERTTITRNGTPVAAIVPFSDVEELMRLREALADLEDDHAASDFHASDDGYRISLSDLRRKIEGEEGRA